MVGPDEYPAPGTGNASWPAPGQPSAPGPSPTPPPPPGVPGAYGQPHPTQPHGQPYPTQPYPGQPYGQPQQPYPPMPAVPQLRPVHKPGAVPLRPLRLGDLLDGAVRIVRHNPGATIGASVLVAALAMLLPLLVTAVYGASANPAFLDVLASESDTSTYTVTGSDVTGLLVVLGSWTVGLMVQNFGSMLVTGMAAHTANAAALGGKLSLSEAWAATAGQRLRILALALLLTAMVFLGTALYIGCWVVVVVYTDPITIVGWAVLTLPLAVAAFAWYWVRLYTLSIPALAVEDLRVGQALSRSVSLSRGSFWRLLGISILVMLITQVGTTLLSTPFSILSIVPLFVGLSEGTAFVVSMAVQLAGGVAASALVLPFIGVVAALLHLDLRMRREAYDVELITRSGATAP